MAHGISAKAVVTGRQPNDAPMVMVPRNDLVSARGFRSGLGLEEPVFEHRPEGTGPSGWGNYQQIPPVPVARMRLAR